MQAKYGNVTSMRSHSSEMYALDVLPHTDALQASSENENMGAGELQVTALHCTVQQAMVGMLPAATPAYWVLRASDGGHGSVHLVSMPAHVDEALLLGARTNLLTAERIGVADVRVSACASVNCVTTYLHACNR